MLVWLITQYRKIPWRPKCRCGGPESCSQRALRLARKGALTFFAAAMLAQSCGSGGGNNPCMPGDPNNPNSCQQGGGGGQAT